MGNEGSSQQGRPPTVLIIEALLWPTTAVVFCRVSLRERGSHEDQLLGEVKQFPGRPLAVSPRHISSMLVLSFHAADGASDAELASLCVPISSLVQFGAPLFTSLWLGLQEGRMETKFESALKYAKSSKAPKVRVAFFRPSLKSFKELELNKDEDSLDSSRKSRAEGDAKGTQAEPDILAALATDVDGPSGLVGRDSGPSLAQQVLGIMKGLRASNEMIWALQTALFARAVLPQQTQQSTSMLMQDTTQVQGTGNEVRARIRVTISEYRGLQNMCCVCEVPGYADLEFKMWHHGSVGSTARSGAGSNLVVGPYDYAECDAYPVGHPLRFAGRLLGLGSDLEEPFAWCDLEGDAFYPDGYRGDLMLLDAKGSAKGTVKVSIDIIAEEQEQCEGEVPFNADTCYFEAAVATSAELSVMLAREGLDIVIDKINNIMLRDFAKKWSKKEGPISAVRPAIAKADTKMNMLPLPTPVKIDQSKAGEGANQEKRQKDWALVESELVEYLTILNSMLESSGTNLQLFETEQRAVCIVVSWQPQTLAAKSKQRDSHGETDHRILHQRIEEQQQVFSEEIMKLRRQHTESILSASRNLSTVQEEFLQQSSELKVENERLKRELGFLRNKQTSASTLEQATHVKRSMDQAASDLEAALDREKVHQHCYAIFEREKAELEEKLSQQTVTLESLTSHSSQQALTIEYLTTVKASAQKEAAERELMLAEMQKAIAQAPTGAVAAAPAVGVAGGTYPLSVSVAPADGVVEALDKEVTKVRNLETALTESMSRESALRQTLDEVDQREAESLEMVRNAQESSQAFQTALKEALTKETASQQALEQAMQREAVLKEQCLQIQEDASKAAARATQLEAVLSDAIKHETKLKEAVAKETALQQALEQATQREAFLKEQCLEAQEDASKAAARVIQMQAVLSDAIKQETTLKEALDQAKEREAKLLERMRSSSDETSKTWQVALREAAERESALRGAVEQAAQQQAAAAQRDAAWKAALDEAALRENALSEALEQSAEKEAVETSNLKEVALQEVAAVLREVEEKDAVLQEVLAKHAALEERLHTEQFLKEAALQNVDAALSEAAKKETELAQALAEKELELYKASEKETAILDDLVQREADLSQIRFTVVGLQEKLQQTADREKAQRDAEDEKKDAAFREVLAMKEANLEQVLAREASLRSELNTQKDLVSNASYKQMAQELEQQKAAALFHKQAAVSSTEEIAIKGEQLKEATKAKAYLKEVVEREAALKDVALEEVAAQEMELKQQQQLVADLQEQLRQAAVCEKDLEMEDKCKELQRQLQGAQDELQTSREAQFQLEEQLIENDPQQAKLRIEELQRQVRDSQNELQNAKEAQFQLEEQLTVNDAQQAKLREELQVASLRVRSISPRPVRSISPRTVSHVKSPATILRTSTPQSSVSISPSVSISRISSPATFERVPRSYSPLTQRAISPLPQSVKYLPQSRTLVNTSASTVSTAPPDVKKATVRCIQCSALNMIQMEGPPTIQCGGCGYEFQVDPTIF